MHTKYHKEITCYLISINFSFLGKYSSRYNMNADGIRSLICAFPYSLVLILLVSGRQCYCAVTNANLCNIKVTVAWRRKKGW